MTAEMFKSQLLYYQKIGKPGVVPIIRFIMWMGLLKNNVIHAGVAIKRILRKLGLFGGLKN